MQKSLKVENFKFGVIFVEDKCQTYIGQSMIKALLEDCIKESIKDSTEDQRGCLTGSNALLWDKCFVAESSDNCARIALLRRVANIQEPKSVKSFISNNHGRTFEDFLRVILSVKNNDIQWVEEEEAQVILEDSNGRVLITARPDKVCRYKGQVFPIEVKTVQSNTTAYSIFIKNKPKLGALLQLAIYMHGHNLNTGYLLYCASNWFSGFAGKGNRWSVEPSFKVFTAEWKESVLFCDGIETVITVNKILNGCYEFLNCKENNILPEIPIWKDYKGETAAYDGCSYCFMKDVCLAERTLTLNQFFTRAMEVLHDSS